MHVLAQPLFAPRHLAGKNIGQLTVAACSALAAGIHTWVVPEHYEEYTLFGVFFAVVAIAQVGWAVAVVGAPSPWLFSAGIALSAGVLAVWLLSRTAGLPVGPEPWAAEPAALLDVVAGAAELGIIVVAGLGQRPAVRVANRSRPAAR